MKSNILSTTMLMAFAIMTLSFHTSNDYFQNKVGKEKKKTNDRQDTSRKKDSATYGGMRDSIAIPLPDSPPLPIPRIPPVPPGPDSLIIK